MDAIDDSEFDAFMKSFDSDFAKCLNEMVDGVAIPRKQIPQLQPLDECREMDKQLAQVALGKFNDIPTTVLEEIFQAVDFIKLLTVRRVCTNWNVVISRDAAPYLRNVVFDLSHTKILGPNDKNMGINYWQFAKRATSIVFVEEKERPNDVTDLFGNGRVKNVLDAYEKQVKMDGRTELIGKVVYAYVKLDSKFLMHPVVTRVGFETVLYESIIQFSPTEIFPYESEEEYNATMTLQRHRSLLLKVQGRDVFVLAAEDVEPSFAIAVGGVGKQELNPLTAYFAVRNARPLDETQLAGLEELLGQVDATHYNYIALAEKLIDKFDAGSKEVGMGCLAVTDVRGFAVAVHPLTAYLFYNIVVEAVNVLWDYEDVWGAYELS